MTNRRKEGAGSHARPAGKENLAAMSNSQVPEQCSRCGGEGPYQAYPVGDHRVPVCRRCWVAIYGPYRRSYPSDVDGSLLYKQGGLPFAPDDLANSPIVFPKTCVHHWIIPEFSRTGTCKKCGEVKEFRPVEFQLPFASQVPPEKEGEGQGFDNPLRAPSRHNNDGTYTYRRARGAYVS